VVICALVARVVLWRDGFSIEHQAGKITAGVFDSSCITASIPYGQVARAGVMQSRLECQPQTIVWQDLHVFQCSRTCMCGIAQGRT
jgi:hypothetical protein